MPPLDVSQLQLPDQDLFVFYLKDNDVQPV